MNAMRTAKGKGGMLRLPILFGVAATHCGFGVVLGGEAPDSSLSGHPKSIADLSLEELGQVRISPFDVSTRLDKGYRASNSISGSRFDVPIRDLPFALQAFTGSFIQDQKPRDLFDIARYAPGITYRSNDFNEGNANLAIRGFAVSSADAGNIPVMRDGFNGPTLFDFTNIERVELLKGPSSFLYGQVAPGGMVNIITKSPQPKHAAIGEVRYGSYGGYRLEADVTGPIAKSLMFRTAISYDQDIHYWKPYDAQSYNLSPSLLWQPKDHLGLTLKYERFIKNETPQLMQKPGYNTQSGLVPTAADPNLSGVDVPGLPDTWNSMSHVDFRDSETNGLSGWFDIKASEHWNVRIGASYLDNTVDALFSGNLGMANNSTLLQGRRLREQVYTNEDASFEAQAVGQYAFSNLSLRLLFGTQCVDRQLKRSAGQAPNDPSLGNNPTASPLPLWDLSDPSTWNRDVPIPLTGLTANSYDQTNNYLDKSAYSGTTFGFFGDKLLALLGWRVTSTRNHLVNNLAARQTVYKNTATQITPQYGALYKIASGLSLFGTYSESFLPGTNLRQGNVYGSVDPIEGQGFDFGLKTDLFKGRLSGTLTLFEIRNRNIINDLATTDSSGTLFINHVQSGEQRSRGIEVDASIALVDNWQIYASYGYMDARNIEFSGQDAAILALDTSTLDAAGRVNYKNVRRFHNARLQMSAPHLANFWTRYNFTQGIFRGVFIGGGVNFVYDQTLLPDSPESSRQTYLLVNAISGYEWVWKGVPLSTVLYGKNLADEQYRPSQSTRSRPREVILSMSVRY